MMNLPYVRFDEREDAVAALELIAAVGWNLKESPSLWKWMVMSMQNAMQAGMVLALAGTDGCGALREKSQERNRAWLEKPEGPQPNVIMADYGTLLYRVQRQELMDGPPLEISADDSQHLEQLNKLRRQFAHFNPQGWSIELKLLLTVMPVALDAIEHLLTTQRRVQLHLTDAQKERITEALSQTREALKAFEFEEKPA